MGLYPALPIAVVLAIFTLLARHALDMRTKQNYREMWGATSLSILPAALFLAIVASGEPSMLKRNLLLIPAGALIGACVFVYGGYVWSDTVAIPPQPPAIKPPYIIMAQLVPSAQGPMIDQSVTSYNQQGGITAHSVTIGPQQRNLDSPTSEQLKQQMLSQLPRDKDITVMAILGDTESITFAQQIHSFLKDNGFKLKEPNGISQGVFTGAVHGLQFNPDTNTFVVGAQ
jgi:hypothetical protein